MRVLLDTNILIRLLNPAALGYDGVRVAVDQIVRRGDEPSFVPQNLVELWNVCSRPANKNGLGLSIAETEQSARVVESEFLLLPETAQVHHEWRRLVVAHSVSGVQVHDAHIVAAMVVHGIQQILTFNDRDFKRYKEITAVHPSRIASVG